MNAIREPTNITAIRKAASQQQYRFMLVKFMLPKRMLCNPYSFFITLCFFLVSLWVQLCLVDLTMMAVKVVKQIFFRTKFVFLNNKKRNFPKLLCYKMKKIICRERERTRLCLFRLNWWIAAVCKHLQLHLHHWPSSNINSFHYPGKWSVGLEKAIFS